MGLTDTAISVTKNLALLRDKAASMVDAAVQTAVGVNAAVQAAFGATEHFLLGSLGCECFDVDVDLFA